MLAHDCWNLCCRYAVSSNYRIYKNLSIWAQKQWLNELSRKIYSMVILWYNLKMLIAFIAKPNYLFTYSKLYYLLRYITYFDDKDVSSMFSKGLLVSYLTMLEHSEISLPWTIILSIDDSIFLSSTCKKIHKGEEWSINNRLTLADRPTECLQFSFVWWWLQKLQ